MQSELVSVVVPVYNVENYLNRCLDSIVSQTYKNIEVILVDDGSTDMSSSMCDEWRYRDNRIKVVNKKNAGLGEARNSGIENATGKYICFVDSDDYISKTLLKDIEPYINQNIDLIKWKPIFVDENGNILKKEESNTFNKVSGEKGFNLLFGKDNLIDCLWNYAIKKELVLEFPKGMYHEYFATMPLMILKANTMVSINKYEYYYVQSQNSIMRNQNEEMERKKLH